MTPFRHTYRPASSDLFLFRRCIPFLSKLGPPWFRRKILQCTPYPALQRVTEIVDHMGRTSQDIFKKKKEALQRGEKEVMNQIAQGKDVMSVLCESSAVSHPCISVKWLARPSKSQHGNKRRRKNARFRSSWSNEVSSIHSTGIIHSPGQKHVFVCRI